MLAALCSCLAPPILRAARLPHVTISKQKRITVCCKAQETPQEDFDDDAFEYDDEEEEEEDEEVELAKFQIATGMSEESDDLEPLPDFLNEDNDLDATASNSGSSWASKPQMDETQRRIEEQQKQIDMLMKMVQSSIQTKASEIPASPLSPSPPIETNELQEYSTPQQPYQQQEVSVTMAPLKAMLFIDGTWLYYSIHGRRERECPIVRKFGRGWHHRYRIDWTALPRMVCEQLQQQHATQGWGNEARSMEIVRASVYTSMKNSTAPQSFRVRMFEELKDANFDVHCMTTVGQGEKCVDIQLAVEMLHYATVPNAYDVAILLSGDKDFLPALVRARQKGRKVGIVSMRTGCNRALYESPNVKDYNMVWIEDFLDQLLVPITEFGDSMMKVSRFTLIKILYDFIEKSGLERVSSRDVGKYLKLITIGGGNLLETIKQGYGGLYHFFNQGEFFDVELRIDQKDPKDKSFWIYLHKDSAQLLLDEAKRTQFTDEEKEFFDTYSLEILDTTPKQKVYFHSIYPDEICPIEYNYWVDRSDNDGEEEEEEEMPAEFTEDYSKYTVVKLKDRCRARGLPVSGTKSILLERVRSDVATQMSEWKEQRQGLLAKRRRVAVNGASGSPPNTSSNPAVTQHLEKLICEYLQASGGLASSRDVGRFLAANAASEQSQYVSALTELKEEYGGVGQFVSQSEVLESQSVGEGSNYEFMVALPGTRGSYKRMKELTDPPVKQHLEALLREYLKASGGHASSRDVGRYLAANAASQQSRHASALTELKEEYGGLGAFVSQSDEFAIQAEGEREFRIDLRKTANS